jgi:hypothetical protein
MTITRQSAVTIQICRLVLLVMLLWRGVIAGELRPRPPNQTSQITIGLIHNSLGRERPSLMEIVLELPSGRPVQITESIFLPFSHLVSF